MAKEKKKEKRHAVKEFNIAGDVNSLKQQIESLHKKVAVKIEHLRREGPKDLQNRIALKILHDLRAKALFKLFSLNVFEANELLSKLGITFNPKNS